MLLFPFVGTEHLRKKCFAFQTVTGDLDSRLVIFLRATRNVGANSHSTDYLMYVDKMRGRVNLAVLSRERLVISKLDGWPEVTNKVNAVSKAMISRRS